MAQRIEETAEHMETQLLERVNATPWNNLQVDEPPDGPFRVGVRSDGGVATSNSRLVSD